MGYLPHSPSDLPPNQVGVRYQLEEERHPATPTGGVSGGLCSTLLEHRRMAMQQAAGKLRQGVTVTALSIMQPLGFMAAAYPVVPLALLHMCRLQRWFASLRLDAKKRRLVSTPPPTLDRG